MICAGCQRAIRRANRRFFPRDTEHRCTDIVGRYCAVVCQCPECHPPLPPDWRPPTMSLDGLEAEAVEQDGAILTEAEHQVVAKAAELYNLICAAVPEGPNRSRDIAELVPHIHIIQRTFMAQAAARAFPDIFRALGESRVVESHEHTH